MFVILTNLLLSIIFIYKVVISIGLSVCFSDHNLGTTGPICLKLWLMNSGDPRKCSYLRFKILSQDWVDLNSDEWINELINSLNQLNNQLINESMNRWINESMNQWINESMNQWINESMNQWINESMNQSINSFNHFTIN